MVWFIRAIFCIARGLVYPGHSLFCALAGLSGPFSARHVQCMSDICKRWVAESGWGGEVVLSSDAVPPQPPPASPSGSNVADAAAASPVRARPPSAAAAPHAPPSRAAARLASPSSASTSRSAATAAASPGKSAPAAAASPKTKKLHRHFCLEEWADGPPPHELRQSE